MRLLVALIGIAAAAQANQYKILVTGATLAATKRVGDAQQPWDIGDGRPDPYVVVALDGEPVYVSGANPDTVRARWFTGTEYWRLPATTAVTITVRDADAGKMVANVGMVGVAVRPDIPKVGKRLINGALASVDTDDTVAVWSGTLAQLIRACGGGAGADIVRSGQLRSNAGLTALRVRVIERPLEFDVTVPVQKRTIGLADAEVETVKRGSGKPWDVGLGGATRPDPRYVVYVNGSPVVAGGVNKDSLTAAWAGDPPPLDLRDEDTIAVAVFDADAGAHLATAGKAAVLFSGAYSEAAKEQTFEALNKMATDDLVFLWVGPWKTLAATTALPPATGDPRVWTNDGLARATVRTRPGGAAPAGPARRVTVLSATIGTTKPGGKAWDMGKGRPDPFVRCHVAAPGGGWKVIGESAAVTDSLTPGWNLSLNAARLTPGARVKFEVFDKDRMSHDLIGSFVVTLPAGIGVFEAHGGAVTRLRYRIAP